MKHNKMKMNRFFTLLMAAVLFSGCAGNIKSNEKNNAEKNTEVHDPMQNKGIGPVSHLDLPQEIDQALALQGKELYDLKCKACHKPTEKFIGPAPKGVLDRRTPEWVMNMILNPEIMIKDDPDAKALFLEYNMAPMANQGITQDEARAMLEYFRTL